MPANITAAFEKQYSKEIKLAYDQKVAKLRGAVTVKNAKGGSTYDFHTMGSVTANTKTRGADLTFLDPAEAVVTATLADSHAAILVNDLDECKTQADVRQGYIAQGANALNRATDNIIVAALDGGSPTAIPTATGAFTYARFLEVLTALNESDVEPEDRVLVVKPKQLEEAMAITQFTSGDYMALNAIRTGQIGEALGFKWIVSNRLTTDAAPTPDADRCYAFSKTAVGLAVGNDISTGINFSADKGEWVIHSKMSMGSVVIEPAGVIQMLCDI